MRSCTWNDLDDRLAGIHSLIEPTLREFALTKVNGVTRGVSLCHHTFTPIPELITKLYFFFQMFPCEYRCDKPCPPWQRTIGIHFHHRSSADILIQINPAGIADRIALQPAANTANRGVHIPVGYRAWGVHPVSDIIFCTFRVIAIAAKNDVIGTVVAGYS